MADETLSALFTSDDPQTVLRAAAAVQRRSSGRIRKPETINRRTGKPERGGLHCALVFGPVADLACLCGKYSGPTHRGQACDRCGVLVGDSSLRDERWGHVECAVPLVHPVVLPQLARALGHRVEAVAAVLAYEADLRDDGTIVAVGEDERSEEPQRGAWRIAAQLGDRAEELMLTCVPVTPPRWRETRHDPQDVAYMRLINRCNRLERLIELGAPEIILWNEARLTQQVFEKLIAVVRAELRVRGPVVIAPVTATSTALLTAIHDDPDSDAARRAYAAHLTAAGDPRGEFIKLQLTGHGRSAAHLLRRNFERWLAPFAPDDLAEIVFRRGFLAGCKLAPGCTDPRIGDPAWSTVEHLACDSDILICDPVMRGLRSLVVGERTLRALGERGWSSWRIDALQLRLSHCPPAQPERITDGEVLPALRALTLVHASTRGAQDWDWLTGTPLARQLSRLTLSLAPERLATLALPWWAEFLARHRNLERLDIALGRRKLAFELRRDGEGLALRVGMPVIFIERVSLGDVEEIDELGRCLTALAPYSVTSLRFDCKYRWYGDQLVAFADRVRDHFGAQVQMPEVLR